MQTTSNHFNWRNHPRIGYCVDALCSGGVIAYPTEAVWGLGCHPFCESAVAQILALKKRPWHKGLILVAGDISQVEFLTYDLPAAQQDTLNQTWPGHISWLLEHKDRIPQIVHGRHTTVAVRVSTHPVIKSLCALFGGPIVSTSANPAGLEPARNVVTAKKYFRNQVVFAPGQVGAQSTPSKIKNLQTGEIVR